MHKSIYACGRIWLPNVKYLEISPKTSQTFPKTNMSDKEGILN